MLQLTLRCHPRGTMKISMKNRESLIAEMQLRTSSKYRVIKLDWEKVLSFSSQLLRLTGLEFVFFNSTIFDVFCVKISLV